MNAHKSSTDLHWNDRAARVADDIEVNIMDIFQRELEYDYVCGYLQPETTVLEVGCGNGFSTNRFRQLVKRVDAFDYSEKMIDRAKDSFGELNNRFFVDNALDPHHISEAYDTVICIRVLINLQNLEQQRQALDNLTKFVKPGGLLILVEGFTEGFAQLSTLRNSLGLPAIEPAKINFYSSISDLMPQLEKHFEIENRFHLGAYDYMTRVVYPLLVGSENVRHNTIFSEKSAELARQHNPDCYEQFSRIRGFVLRKQA